MLQLLLAIRLGLSMQLVSLITLILSTTIEHHSPPCRVALSVCVLYMISMTFNPYIQQVADQEGVTTFDVRRSMRNSTPRKREFPCEIHGRYFATKAQYERELHEFLNGM